MKIKEIKKETHKIQASDNLLEGRKAGREQMLSILFFFISYINFINVLLYLFNILRKGKYLQTYTYNTHKHIYNTLEQKKITYYINKSSHLNDSSTETTLLTLLLYFKTLSPPLVFMIMYFTNFPPISMPPFIFSSGLSFQCNFSLAYCARIFSLKNMYQHVNTGYLQIVGLGYLYFLLGNFFIITKLF